MGKRIIFFATPAYGHVSSVLPVIRRLVQRGHKVTWYCTSKFRTMVEESGASYVEYPGEFDARYDLAEITSDFYHLMDYLLKLNRRYYEEYVEAIDWTEVDLILYDSMCSFAKNIARKKRLRSICLCTTMAYNRWTFCFSNMIWSTIPLVAKHGVDILKKLREEKKYRHLAGLPKLDLMDLFINAGDETIVFIPRALQPFVKTFPKSYSFVGTTIKERAKAGEAEEKRRQVEADDKERNVDIYISLGTIFTENETLLKTIMKDPFFADKNVIINVGKLQMKSSSPNIRLVSHTNQIELLKHCKMFINHGGLNSVWESIYRHVPQVCIPQQEEQRMTALVAKRRGLVTYTREFDIDKIKACYEGGYDMRRIRQFAEIIKRADGTRRAVRIIERNLWDRARRTPSAKRIFNRRTICFGRRKTSRVSRSGF